MEYVLAGAVLAVVVWGLALWPFRKQLKGRVTLKQVTMARQGDVLVRRIESAGIPDAVKRAASRLERFQPLKRDDGRIVLAYGEVTGHAHALAEPGVQAWLLGDTEGHALMQVPEGGAVLRHDVKRDGKYELSGDHSSVALAPGMYEVIRQREAGDHDTSRVVVD